MRYQIWNKTDDIITPSGAQFTAGEWADRYPWAKLPGVKMVVSAPPINGGCALEYAAMKAQYKRLGATITDEMTDEEVLAAIEDFEDNPPDPGPSVEERTAAALEAQAMLASPDAPSAAAYVVRVASKDAIAAKSAAFVRIRDNYDRGLWGASMLSVAVQKGYITEEEQREILNGMKE